MIWNARKYIKTHRRARRWLPVLLCLAVVLLFGTVSALTLPANTMQPQCGFAEHTHTDACYTQVEDGAQETLTCTEAHEHNARCYGTWVVACGKAEHTHTEACFPEAAAFSAEQETAMLKISLLYGDEQPQSTYPDGVFSDTTSTMVGYLRLEPSNASEGETRPSAEDDIRFRVTDDPVGRGSFGKVAYKGISMMSASIRQTPIRGRSTCPTRARSRFSILSFRIGKSKKTERPYWRDWTRH